MNNDIEDKYSLRQIERLLHIIDGDISGDCVQTCKKNEYIPYSPDTVCEELEQTGDVVSESVDDVRVLCKLTQKGYRTAIRLISAVHYYDNKKCG